MSIAEARTFVRNFGVIVQSQLNTRRRDELSWQNYRRSMSFNEISDGDRSERTLASSVGMKNTLESNLSLDVSEDSRTHDHLRRRLS
jgi:hypothetical protein